MELGQELRPRLKGDNFKVSEEPRKKCTVCCAARYSAMVGGFVFAVTAPCSFVCYPAWAKTWLQVANRYLYLPLPVTATCFTHQLLLSTALWSKNEKTLWDLNYEITAFNVLMWIGLITCGTLFSRYTLASISREYRLQLWDYRRQRRGHHFRYMITMFGTVTETLDCVNVWWCVAMYHICWFGLCVAVDAQQRATYAMFYDGVRWSEFCAPRWREFREREIQRQKYNTERPMESGQRWGNAFSLDHWRST